MVTSNAKKFLINSLASGDGQLALSKATGAASRRLDVPHDHLSEYVVPKEGTKYSLPYGATYIDEVQVKVSVELLSFLKTLIGGR